MSYCEDYPCCGHTPADPCERQWYDEPGAFDTSVNPHALCDHEFGDCYVDEYEDEFDPDECEHVESLNFKNDGTIECADCYTIGGRWVEGADGWAEVVEPIE